MNNNLVFLCGFPSSGTDLLKNLINAHSDVFINGEFPLLFDLADKYTALVPVKAVDEIVANLRKIDIHENFENPNLKLNKSKSEYKFSEIYSLMLNKKKVKWKGNKTPQNTENIDKIRILFPKAKFILIVRDIRDIALSWEKKWGKNKLLCAWKWNNRMLLGYNYLQNINKNDFLILKYEDLLYNLSSTSQKVCDFLDIEYQDNMLEYHKFVSKKLDGKLNYGEPLIKSNTGKWRQIISPREVIRIEEVAFQALQLFDYSITSAKEYRPLTKIEKYTGIVHDIYALIFIGNKAIKNNQLYHHLKSVKLEYKKAFNFLYKKNKN